MSKPDISIFDLIAAHLSEQGIWCEICSRSYLPSFIRFANHCSFPYHYGTISQEEMYIYIKVEQLHLTDAECFDLTDPQLLTKLVEYIKQIDVKSTNSLFNEP